MIGEGRASPSSVVGDGPGAEGRAWRPDPGAAEVGRGGAGWGRGREAGARSRREGKVDVVKRRRGVYWVCTGTLEPLSSRLPRAPPNAALPGDLSLSDPFLSAARRSFRGENTVSRGLSESS